MQRVRRARPCSSVFENKPVIDVGKWSREELYQERG